MTQPNLQFILSAVIVTIAFQLPVSKSIVKYFLLYHQKHIESLKWM